MRNIVVVECISTGKNYIQDIINRNYNPVVLETKTMGDSLEARRYKEDMENCYASIDHDFDLIYEQDSYEETLEIVRKYDPLLVIPGSEKGVILATKLANDLGLMCNPIENIDSMTLKHKMHEKLVENNLRSIRGRVIRSVEEAIEFYDSEGLQKVVVKPIYSAGSVGVRLCDNKAEMIKSIDEVFSLKGHYGNNFNELLIQEQIEGPEYIVNTVTCDGIHRVTSILRYSKIKTIEGGNIYDYIEFIPELGIGEPDLVEYAYDVADALGIRYGPVHGEYMIDENGPVLIEVNCRPMGGTFDAEYLDKILGHHETNCVLDSYLNPDKFHIDLIKGYETLAYAFVKMFIVPRDLIVKCSPIGKLGIKLKSHYKTIMNMGDELNVVTKTQDLNTFGGVVYLVNNDFEQITRDIDFLRKIETRAFDLVLSEERIQTLDIDENKIVQNIETLLEDIKICGTPLLVTEKIFEDLAIAQVTIENIDDIKGTFDCVVVNLNEGIYNQCAEGVSKKLSKIFEKVRIGGLIFIPNTTYDYLPNGKLGLEALLKLQGFCLEMPIHTLTGMVIASKCE
ncbi:ATP-grasp domain-containing protein [Methanobrevibacter sp.]|uniref:ATP-grasp domain-containing protein n=1 Tax=Methanobrevibacter sp. TaxID=66852 RepID=UPI003890C9A3